MRKWWRAVANRRRFEDELADELKFHLEALAADLQRGGLTPEEALRRARLELGSPEHYKEECRQARGLRWLDELTGDLRYGFRGLARNRLYATVACLTLTLGFGANATIFSLVNSVMLKTLPVDKPEQLQAIYWTARAGAPIYQSSSTGSSTREGSLRVADMFSYPHFLRLRADTPAGVDLFGHSGIMGRVSVTVDRQAELARVGLTSWNYFRGLGVAPLLGRTFAPSDEDPRSSLPPVLISYDYWGARFGRAGDVLGRTLELSDVRAVVVGVLPPGFHGLMPGDTVDVVAPLTIQDLLHPGNRLTDGRNWWVQMMARVDPSIPPARVSNEHETRLLALLKAEPVSKQYDPPKIRLVSGAKGLHWLRTRLEQPLRLLMLVALLILLMAGVNVGGLLLARAEARMMETSVRLALGSSRARLTRQHLTESLLLACIGLTGGLALAWLLAGTLPSLLARGGEAPILDLSPDWRFLGLAITATLILTLLFGLYPAWKSARSELTFALRRSQGARSGRLPMGRVLVGAQVGLSLILLTGAAMFLRTVSNLRSLQLGFVPDHLLVFGVNPGKAGHRDEARLRAYYDRALERLSAIPGVKSASLSRHALLQGSSSSMELYYRDDTGRTREVPNSYTHHVSSTYLETMGVPVVAGRGILASDTATSPKVVVVNQRLARLIRPDGRSPVGLTVNVEKDGSEPLEIVGVVPDVKYDSLRREAPLTAYMPFTQRLIQSAVFSLKTAGDPARFAAEARKVMADLDPRVPPFDMRTQDEQIGLAMEQERVLARLLTGFGALALLLACIGIYGVLSYSVARRTGEIGIRSALGASEANLRGLILVESLWPVGLGLAAGLGGAWWFTRLAKKLVFGIKPMDDWSVAGAVVVLACAAAISSWLPARRASRIAPVDALRCE